MKYQKILLTVLAVSGMSAAAKPIFKQDFASLKPGSSVLPADSSNRSRLFPDPLPSSGTGFSLVKAPTNFQAIIADGGLKLNFKGKPATGSAELKLNLPPSGGNMTFAIKLKLTDFVKGKKVPNMFFVYVAGVNLCFRSDRKDLRCFSMKTKKYARIAMVKNEEWYNIKVNMRFQKNGKSVFDLYLNDKELLKNAAMRGTTSKLVNIRFVMHSRAKNSPSPTILIEKISLK